MWTTTGKPYLDPFSSRIGLSGSDAPRQLHLSVGLGSHKCLVKFELHAHLWQLLKGHGINQIFKLLLGQRATQEDK